MDNSTCTIATPLLQCSSTRLINKKYMKLTIFITIVLIALVTIISAKQDKINTAKFDKCYAQYENAGIGRQYYDSFMKNCYEI